jgi:hypothetical protein
MVVRPDAHLNAWYHALALLALAPFPWLAHAAGRSYRSLRKPSVPLAPTLKDLTRGFVESDSRLLMSCMP